jgi:hypothetical protein
VVLGEREVHTYELNKVSSYLIIRITNILVGSFIIYNFGFQDFWILGLTSLLSTVPASLAGHRTPGTSLLIVSVQNAETNLAKSVFCRSGEDVLYILADAHAV